MALSTILATISLPSGQKARKRTLLFRALAVFALTLLGVVDGHLVPSSSAQALKPNVVIIMTDDQDVDSLPVMRNLLSYPEGSWVRFNQAFVNDSLCCPARSTVLTGQYAHTTGVVSNGTANILDDTNTLPVWLDQAGYHTGLVGKYLNYFPWDRGSGYIPPGWDYFNESIDGDVDAYTEQAVNFINSSSSPFFLYLAYRAPHYPATPPARYANADVYIPPDRPNFNEADVSDKPRWVRNLNLLRQTTIDAGHTERIASQRELLGIDDGVQRVVDALKAKGQLDNTMIIFLADNAFSWGSHRWIHKECGYEECSQIPLFIRLPGLGSNREENRLVSNVDLAATIAEYTGVTPGLPQDGRSFLSVLTNTATAWKDEVFLKFHASDQLRTFYGIRVPGWRYAEYTITGEKELYDLTHDPYELQNQANWPAYQAIQSQLAGRIHAILAPPSADLIFGDGFETGTFAKWSMSTADDGALSVSGAAALVGSRGLQAVIDDNKALYLTDQTPAFEPHYRARFYFDPDSIAMNSGNAHVIFQGTVDTSLAVLRVDFRFYAGAYQLRAGMLNDGTTWTNSEWFAISDGAHALELDWHASTAPGANDGSLTFWIDGVQKASRTGFDNDLRRIDRVRLGAVQGIDSGTRGTYYFDDFRSRRHSYIGLSAGAQPAAMGPTSGEQANLNVWTEEPDLPIDEEPQDVEDEIEEPAGHVLYLPSLNR